jgi:sugar-specific transcriptional regulator TrmB
MNIRDLTKIGLTDGEIRVYDALLDLGETTRTKLAKRSGISPSKVYDVVYRLVEKGIVSVVKKQGTLHFSAANPERLKDFIEGKEEELRQERSVVDTLLPALLSRHGETREKLDVEVFYGWDGMRTVFWDIARALDTGDVSYVFGASMGQDWLQADTFFSKYYQEVEKKGYCIRIIFNENMRNHKDRTGYFETHKQHRVRYLHQDTFTEINFYNDTVLFIMLLRKPLVIRITNKEAADSFRKFFLTMWKQAKR